MTARDLLFKLARVTGFILWVFTSVTWPYFANMTYEDQRSKRDLANLTVLQRRIKSCLLLNLSFFLEPIVRIRLAKILTSHVGDPLSDFDITNAKLNQIMSRRNLVALNFVPTDHLVRCIGSAGFFSLRCHPRLQNKFSITPSMKNLILLVSLTRKFGRSGRKLLSHIGSSQPESSLHDFRSVLTSRGQSTEVKSEILIVGPGVTSHRIDYKKFDEIWWLLTPSTDSQRLAEIMTKGGNHWLVCNNVAAKSASDPLNSEYSRLLRLARGVISHEQWEVEFHKSALPTRNFLSPLAESFWNGSPNLLPRAIGLAILRMAKITVIGADLYTGENLYRLEANRAQTGSDQTAQLHPFFTCISLSGHNPLSNFNAIKLAALSGFVVGSPEFLRLANLSAKSYLERIDYSVGLKRK